MHGKHPCAEAFGVRLALLLATFAASGLQAGADAVQSEDARQETPAPASPADSSAKGLFADEDPLELTLTAELKAIFKDRDEDRPYRPAVLSYRAEDGTTVSFDIGVKTRGYYRRLYLNCNVPPLRLNFKKKEVRNTLFDGQDKIKLVTHCKDKNDVYEQYTLQEYLIYRAYNLLTDKSFRVRLVRMTYVDTADKRDTVTKYSFLIEDEERLAERLGGRILESGVIHQEAGDRALITLLAVFQYMIGNTDWSTLVHHNIRHVFVDPQSPPYAVPYDFDMAGIINTRYAGPDPRLGIKSVRERLFRGYCRTEEEFDTVFAYFNERREALYLLYRTFPLLDQKYRDRALEYLDAFYETINEPKAVRREFLNTCLTR